MSDGMIVGGGSPWLSCFLCCVWVVSAKSTAHPNWLDLHYFQHVHVIVIVWWLWEMFKGISSMTPFWNILLDRPRKHCELWSDRDITACSKQGFNLIDKWSVHYCSWCLTTTFKMINANGKWLLWLSQQYWEHHFCKEIYTEYAQKVSKCPSLDLGLGKTNDIMLGWICS